MRKLKTTEIPKFREAILKLQGHKCAICGSSLRKTAKYTPALDHCHTTGQLRGVLCLMCNQAEGRIKTRANQAKKTLTIEEWLQSLVDYLNQPQRPYIHPTHKTEAEKRLARNKKARAKRAALKGK